MRDEMSIAALAPRIAAGDLSATRVTGDALERIARINPEINAFITVLASQAREQATLLRLVLPTSPLATVDKAHTVPVRFRAKSPGRRILPCVATEGARTVESASGWPAAKRTQRSALSSFLAMREHPGPLQCKGNFSPVDSERG